MSDTVFIIVGMKIPDPVCLSALHCLKVDMHYAKVLLSLQKRDFWKVSFRNLSSTPPEKFGTYLAENTRIFVNPNKHFFQVYSEKNRPRATESPEGVFKIPVWITDTADDHVRRLAPIVNEQCGLPDEVIALTRGSLWFCDLKAESIEHARRLALQIAVARDVRKGLLANPHFQSVIIT